jgi:hypothetical protein
MAWRKSYALGGKSQGRGLPFLLLILIFLILRRQEHWEDDHDQEQEPEGKAPLKKGNRPAAPPLVVW